MGHIYTFDPIQDEVKLITKQGNTYILSISFIDEDRFVFSLSGSPDLYQYSFSKQKVEIVEMKLTEAWYLHNIPKDNLLLAGLANGLMVVYQVTPTELIQLESIQAHKQGKYCTTITSFEHENRKYVVTGGNDQHIVVWDRTSGAFTEKLRIKLDKIDVSTIVYLEAFNVLATTHHKDFVKFWRFPEGDCIKTVHTPCNTLRNIISLPNYNMVAAADLKTGQVQLISLT